MLYYYIANCYGYMTGGMEYSLRHFWMAIRIEPEKYEYYLDMAAILKTLGRYNLAIEILDTAKKIFPEYGNADDMKARVYEDMKLIYKAQESYKLGKKLSKFTFDDYNKIWIPPRSENKTGENCTRTKESVHGIKLPKGIEYLKITGIHDIKECVNNVEFEKVEYNQRLQSYAITFQKDMCDICESYDKCISSRADSANKALLKKSIIKHVLKNKELRSKDEEQFDKTIGITTTAATKEAICKFIEGLTNKYGENFELIEKSKEPEMTENHEILNKRTKMFMETIVDGSDRVAADDLDEFYYKFSTSPGVVKYNKMVSNANELARMEEYDKAIKAYKIVINQHLKNYFQKLDEFDSVKLLKSFKKFSDINFSDLDEMKSCFTAELYHNTAKMYLSKRNYTKAKELLGMAIDYSPEKYTMSYISLGDVYMEEGNCIKAYEYYYYALKLGDRLGRIGMSNAMRGM